MSALTREKLPVANNINDLIFCVLRHFQQYFSYIIATRIIVSNNNLHRSWKACDLMVDLCLSFQNIPH